MHLLDREIQNPRTRNLNPERIGRRDVLATYGFSTNVRESEVLDVRVLDAFLNLAPRLENDGEVVASSDVLETTGKGVTSAR